MKPASRQPCTGLICNEVENRGEVKTARQKKTAPSETEEDVETTVKETLVSVMSEKFGKTGLLFLYISPFHNFFK